MLRIAIDGPAGSGKSTISKILAEKYDLMYLDTGAMYRTCTYIALKYKLKDNNLIKKLKETDIILKNNKVFIKSDNDFEEITDKIRTVEVSKNVSKIAAIPEIRQILMKKQQQIAAENNVIMDGRDIGTVIIPDAELKIFLTAKAEKRALRRFEEIKNTQKTTYEEVLKDIKMRDFNDINRKISPLTKADDAIEIDTSNMSINDVINEISNLIEKVK